MEIQWVLQLPPPVIYISFYGSNRSGGKKARVPITVRGTAFNPVSSSLPIIHRLSAKCYEASIASNKHSKMGHAPSHGKNDKEQQQKKTLSKSSFWKTLFVSVSICLLEALCKTDVLFSPRLSVHFFSLYYSSELVLLNDVTACTPVGFLLLPSLEQLLSVIGRSIEMQRVRVMWLTSNRGTPAGPWL